MEKRSHQIDDLQKITHANITNFTVLRRNGESAHLDIKKIRDVVEWACNGFDVNPIELESRLTMRLVDKTTTKNIQDNLVQASLELCDLNEPDWRYVAGRLEAWSLWKDILVSRGYGYEQYPNLVLKQVEQGIYDRRILEYSYEELEEASSWIEPDRDKDYDYAGFVLLKKRYLLKDELPQEAILTSALLLVLPEPKEKRLEWARKIYDAVSLRKLSLATPMLANLRSPNGSVTSCFICAMDDTLESIFGEITNAARISKFGGGVGMNLSRIRATGSTVMKRENASGGVIPWVKLLNDTAIAVDQGGSRAGAITVSLDIWHFDIPVFLEMQTENGDRRLKAYDLFPQLVIPDEFMRRVKDKQEWTLVCPYEVKTVFGINLPELWGKKFEVAYQEIEANCDLLKLVKKVNARDLFKEIMRTQVETGLPYFTFKDTINKANPNQHDGYIPGANLCCESWSNVKPGELAHTCNLVSLNAANIEDDEWEDTCAIAVHLLDNSIEITTTPIVESKAHNDRYRTIGVGVMGLADWLAKKEITYTHLDEIDHLFEDIAYFTTKTSADLAIERGCYPVFEGSEWSKGNLLGAKSPEFFLSNSYDIPRWNALRSQIQSTGIRNSHITAIAPNTSSSLVQGCTASILPVFSRFFSDKWAKGVVPIMPPFIKDKFWFYKENKTLNQKVVVMATSVIQKWVDTGISMELLFNLNEGVYFEGRSISAKDIYRTLFLAWEQECKAIYYIRTVQKDSFKEISECSSCAN